MNLHAIPRGRDRATPIGELAEALRMSRRALERALEAFVLSGVPIVACPEGVYIATSPAEARAYADSLRGRIAAVQGRISALEKWADSRDGEQTRLPWTEAA